VDVRVMAATHRDLEAAIADRTFREDLYYRLNVINIHIPPLRDRKEDILPLAEFLMRKHTSQGVPLPTLNPDLRHAMMTYHWPGNVRELENYVRKLIILREPDPIARELQQKTARRATTSVGTPKSMTRPVPAGPRDISSPILERVSKARYQAEADAILAALNSTRWNRKQAAALLKIDYKALLYKMKKLGADDPAVTAVLQLERTLVSGKVLCEVGQVLCNP
jgi:two-component system response regulator AtoC